MALLWAAPSYGLTNAPFKQAPAPACGQPHCPPHLVWHKPSVSARGFFQRGQLQAQAQAQVQVGRKLRALPTGTDASQQESAIDESVEGAAFGTVTAVDKDTFWPIANAAGDKLVVLDMYTQWCGPCKLIAPKLVELSAEYTDVLFLKLDCNQDNKPLAKELGVRVVPTFKLLKHGKVVAEVAGAKYQALLTAIDAARTDS